MQKETQASHEAGSTVSGPVDIATDSPLSTTFCCFCEELPVSVKRNTPPEKRTPGKISLKNTKSGAGEEFLLLDCTVKARSKGVFLQTPV